MVSFKLSCTGHTYDNTCSVPMSLIIWDPPPPPKKNWRSHSTCPRNYQIDLRKTKAFIRWILYDKIAKVGNDSLVVIQSAVLCFLEIVTKVMWQLASDIRDRMMKSCSVQRRKPTVVRLAKKNKNVLIRLGVKPLNSSLPFEKYYKYSSHFFFQTVVVYMLQLLCMEYMYYISI